MEEFFWHRRAHILNTLLHQTKQKELSETEFQEMIAVWEKTFTESRVTDPVNLGVLLNELCKVTKATLEKMDRKWYGKERTFK